MQNIIKKQKKQTQVTGNNTINIFKKKKSVISIQSYISNMIRKATMSIFAINFQKSSMSFSNLRADD